MREVFCLPIGVGEKHQARLEGILHEIPPYFKVKDVTILTYPPNKKAKPPFTGNLAFG
jgi:hypothetical protein